ncbi:FUSC family protein [Actinomadura rudentiformis]|uniref:FUSC family protein n=1 Tax=Actinomadura rudentiformis TaxID=359158 RepID=A0A6H9YMT7_9ACTN|nr:aromatic acid exporter family protein [Actinomadura rudentiformis]KAB2342647.1 FUSC family protein [Actinomadura rudentiformis]
MRLAGQVVRARGHLEQTRRSLRRAVRGPGRERDLLVQSMKAALAALLAWMIAYEWLGAPLSFLAPWVALVMVHATVYQSVVKGVQQVLTVLIGLLAAAGGHLVTGDPTLALALVLVATAPLANWHVFGDQGIYAPLTAVFVITTGAPEPAELVSRLAETGLGIVVGVAVNAVLLPPVHLRDSREAIDTLADEITGCLRDVAGGLRGEWGADEARDWLRRADRAMRLTDDARSAVGWGQESLRLNVRRSRWHDDHSAQLQAQLLPLEIVAKQNQGICRTLVDAVADGMPSPDPRFVTHYTKLLDHAAAVVEAYRRSRLSGTRPDTGPEHAGPELADAIGAARQRRRRMQELLHSDEFETDGWVIYGALLLEVDRLLTGMTPR